MKEKTDIFQKLAQFNNPKLYSPGNIDNSSFIHPHIYRESDLYQTVYQEINLPHQTAFISQIPNSPIDFFQSEKIRNQYVVKKSVEENQDLNQKKPQNSSNMQSNKITKTGNKQSHSSTKIKNKNRSHSNQPETHSNFRRKEDIPKLIMINDVECVKIAGKASEFVFDQKFSLNESCKIEFKTFIKDDFKYGTQNTFNIVLKYICAFLNSYGGTMYLGIKDDGTVTGVEVNDKIENDFENFVKIELQKFVPVVFPWQVEIKYHNIMLQGNKLALYRRKIVEIHVSCYRFNLLYANGHDEIHIRRAASTNNLLPIEIIHLLKIRNNPLLMNQDVMSNLNHKIFDEMTMNELNEIIENTRNTLLDARYYKLKSN